ncbi:MAG: hypothetical protein C0467_18895 [Planctomycetaceae bacterium]|nr:hypothetical protein [Planctomycetaceae bacterium]
MPSITRSVVRRRNWRWSPGNEHTPRGWVCFPGPGTAVAEFEFFDDAEADWGKRESAVRLKMNPFECGPLPMVSSLPDTILRDFLMDTGIEPPAAGIEWDAWWTANREQLSDEQRARVWQAVDKVRFFEITEEAIGPEVHVVVDVTWEERVGIYVADWDGGEVIRVCRHSQRAGEISRGRSQQSRIAVAGRRGVDGPPFANCRPCNVPDPFTPGSTRLLRLPQVPFNEVLTIPFDETRDSGPVSQDDRITVVIRRDYASGPLGFRISETDYVSAGVPVKAFADWDLARDHAKELERTARSWFNPFLIASDPRELGGWSPESVRESLIQECRGYGIPLPAPDCNHAEWWLNHVSPLPAEFRSLLYWAVFDEVNFYTVMRVEFEG